MLTEARKIQNNNNTQKDTIVQSYNKTKKMTGKRPYNVSIIQRSLPCFQRSRLDSQAICIPLLFIAVHGDPFFGVRTKRRIYANLLNVLYILI